jgi:hypothetical protein
MTTTCGACERGIAVFSAVTCHRFPQATCRRQRPATPASQSCQPQAKRASNKFRRTAARGSAVRTSPPGNESGVKPPHSKTYGDHAVECKVGWYEAHWPSSTSALPTPPLAAASPPCSLPSPTGRPPAALANAEAQSLECGDVSPLSAGDLSPSTARDLCFAFPPTPGEAHVLLFLSNRSTRFCRADKSARQRKRCQAAALQNLRRTRRRMQSRLA